MDSEWIKSIVGLVLICSVILIIFGLKVSQEEYRKNTEQQQKKEEEERQKQKELIKESLSELFEEKGVLIEDKDGTSYILDKNGSKVEINIENIEYLENLNIDSLLATDTD